MPTWDQLRTFTWDQLSLFTWDQMKLDVSELLQQYKDSKIPLTADVLEKLQRLAGELPAEQRKITFRTVGDALNVLRLAIDIGEKLNLPDHVKALIGEIVKTLSNLLD